MYSRDLHNAVKQLSFNRKKNFKYIISGLILIKKKSMWHFQVVNFNLQGKCFNLWEKLVIGQRLQESLPFEMPGLLRKARKSQDPFFLGPGSASAGCNSGQHTRSQFPHLKMAVHTRFLGSPFYTKCSRHKAKNHKLHSDNRRRLIFTAKPRNCKAWLMTLSILR